MSLVHNSVVESVAPRPISPAATTRLVPTFSAALVERVAPSISPNAIGTIAAPASRGEEPFANCRNWGGTKVGAESENEAKLIDAEPMLNRGLRKRLRSSIGAA